MLPIWKDDEDEQWYYNNGDGDVGPFKTFGDAAASYAQAIQSCKSGSCEE